MPHSRPAPLRFAGQAALALTLALSLGSCGGDARRGPYQSPSQTRAGPSSSSGFDGAALPTGVRAPGFALTDQRGRRISLGAFRGQVVILTFLTADTTGASALIAQQIRGALDDLARPVPALAVSADPAGDSPARVRTFLASAALTGRMEFLVGTHAQLAPIWRAYRVLAPASMGRARFEAAATVLLIDPRGRERVLFGIEQLTPEGLAHDVRRLQAGD